MDVVHTTTLRKTIVSCGLGASSDGLALAQPTWHAFAALHGWQVAALDRPQYAGNRQEAKSTKLSLIREALANADVVLWLDADAMIIDPSVDIVGSFYEGDFQAFALEHFSNRFNPNTGVWLLRNREETWRFLEAVEAVQLPERYVWEDQARVMATLGWQLVPMPHGVKPVHPSPYLARTGWLSPEWNVISPEHQMLNSTVRIRHFAGQANARRPMMLQQLAELVRRSTVSIESLDQQTLDAVGVELRW
jgi:hypothetical protein